MLKDIDLERTGGRQQLRGALREGSFLVRSTVPESLLEEAYGFLRVFFALPAEEKGACRVPGGNGQAGYLAPPAPPAPPAGLVGEGRELFHWGARLPARHPLRVRFPARYPDPYFPDHLVPGIGSALRELHVRMLRFQHRVVRTLADALGAHPDYFTDLLEDGPAVNRATWHPPARHPSADCRVREAAHQDPGLITTLPRASAPGLEVLADGEWLPAEVPPGHAVVSVGTALDRLTDGVARAAVRRVVARPGHGEGRLSLAQSCHPAPWATLAPLPAPGQARRPRRFATLTAEELFQRALYRTAAPAGNRPGPATR